MGTLELRQEELGHSLDHNTSLTQESWGMLSSLSYDWQHGAYYPRHIQTSSPRASLKLGGRDRQCPGKSSYLLVPFSLVKKRERIAMLRINVWKSVQTLILEMMNSCSV